MEASCWVARKIFLSLVIASSSALTLDSRPTTNGVIMNGKMTTSRMGIIGNRFVSDFSLEVSIFLGCRLSVTSCRQEAELSASRQTGFPDNRQMTTGNQVLS